MLTKTISHLYAMMHHIVEVHLAIVRAVSNGRNTLYYSVNKVRFYWHKWYRASMAYSNSILLCILPRPNRYRRGIS